jgi:hypothetical protein
LIDTWTGAGSGSMFGTVEIVAVFVAVITIMLLGLLIVILFVIVKRLKTVQSGQINQNTAHRYNKLEQFKLLIIISIED